MYGLWPRQASLNLARPSAATKRELAISWKAKRRKEDAGKEYQEDEFRFRFQRTIFFSLIFFSILPTTSVTVHAAAGDWSIFRPIRVFWHQRRWPKTWTRPPLFRPINGYPLRLPGFTAGVGRSKHAVSWQRGVFSFCSATAAEENAFGARLSRRSSLRSSFLCVVPGCATFNAMLRRNNSNPHLHLPLLFQEIA